jgi:hypothetical protein
VFVIKEASGVFLCALDSIYIINKAIFYRVNHSTGHTKNKSLEEPQNIIRNLPKNTCRSIDELQT